MHPLSWRAGRRWSVERASPWAAPLLVTLAGCSQEPAATSRPAALPSPASRPAAVTRGYDLANPDRSFALPAGLLEVSGITAAAGDRVACIQDEAGTIFELELAQGQVARARRFGPRGDYEGLTRAGDAWWVLRSDGTLLETRDVAGELAVQGRHALATAHRDWEGLAFDPTERRLLLVPKDVPRGSDKEERRERPVYAFDLERKALVPEPVLRLDIKDLVAQADRLDLRVPSKTTNKGRERPALVLRPSEVAVHPRTGELWLLSAVDRVVAVVDRTGKLLGLHQFPPADLPKPEGLAFLDDGTLAIASEGVNGPAVLRLYGLRE